MLLSFGILSNPEPWTEEMLNERGNKERERGKQRARIKGITGLTCDAPCGPQGKVQPILIFLKG